MFNKYRFIEELNQELKDECLKLSLSGDSEDEIYENLRTYIDESLENAVIYYNECFDIIKALQFTSFHANDNDLGMRCTDVSKAAYCALYELIDEELNDLYLIIKENK